MIGIIILQCHVYSICIYSTIKRVLEIVYRKRGDRINLLTPGALNSSALSLRLEQLYYTKLPNCVHR